MPDYTITLVGVQDKAVAWKAAQLKKTKAELFKDLIVDSLIASWIRDMLDSEKSTIGQEYENAGQAKKDQIKAILGIIDGIDGQKSP